MDTIKIGSFNLRNHYWDKNWDGNDFPEQLANFIKINNIALLGTQELVKKYSYKLQKELGKPYTISGKYRYGKIPFIDQFNESNAIITNNKIINTETKHLATIPFIDHLSPIPRIMTSVETPEHFMINTHIEFLNKTSQKHQLKLLYNYIKENKEKSPIITGDFNMDTTKDYFIEFIKELQKLGINYVENSIPTSPTKEQVLDHIFISKNYKIQNVEVIRNKPINQISDHHPIIVKVRKRY